MKIITEWFQDLVRLLKEIWDRYDIQAVVLTSLALQLLLVFLAPLRKRSKNNLILGIIWLCYLLADNCATFGTGQISRGDSGFHIAAFWAPFLLLHLGAPHNITALALEDNGLWLRHLLTLIFQVPLIVYVFLRYQIHKTDLFIPAVGILAAGIFKYTERVSSLSLASLPSIRRGIKVPLKSISELDNRSEFEEASNPNLSEIEVVQRGYLYYQSFIRFVIDHTFSQLEEDVAKKFFSSLRFEDAFRVMEVELNFMYDTIFTKMASFRQVIFSTAFTYIYPFLSHALVVMAAVKFFTNPNCKKNVDPRDISITYALLGGSIVLDLIAFVNLLFSEWTIALLVIKVPRWRRVLPCLKAAMTSWRTVDTITSAKRSISSSKRWSREMRQYNLIKHSVKEQPFIFTRILKFLGLEEDRILKFLGLKEEILKFLGLKEAIDSWQHTTSKQVEGLLMELVFECVKKKKVTQVEGVGAPSLRPLRSIIIPKLEPFQKEYEKCVMVLHIATEICYIAVPREKENRELAEVCSDISDYLAYLVLMDDLITTTVPGMRFRDIYQVEEMIAINGKLLHLIIHHFYTLFPSWTSMRLNKDHYVKPRKANATVSKQLDKIRRGRESVTMLDKIREICSRMVVNADPAGHEWILHEAMTLARDLKYYVQNPAAMQDEDPNPNADDYYCLLAKEVWEDLSQVWMEFLLYTASHCRGDVQYLSRGGEFITYVRLLMAHFGLRECFRDDGGAFQLHALFH